MTLIRVSSADWGQLYLMEERGLSTYNAGGFGTALECGGVFGTTIIGAMADFAIKKVNYPTGRSYLSADNLAIFGNRKICQRVFCLCIAIRF